VSFCRLDIDIYKNVPHVLLHEQQANEHAWRGLEISVVIGGKWGAYQAKVLNYLKQLAVITPYAEINMEYRDQEAERSVDTESSCRAGTACKWVADLPFCVCVCSKSWKAQFLRRTDVMPPVAREMKHHPSSVDNLLVEQLIHEQSGGSASQHKLKHFLKNSFSSINAALADRLIAELGLEPDQDVRQLEKKQIHRITALFRQAKFPMPDANVRQRRTSRLHPGQACVA